MQIGKMLVALSAFVTAAALAAPPEWISGNPEKYPGASYLIGRGAGATAEEAQNRARGNLAAIFEVRVEVATENTTTSARTGNREQVEKFALQRVSAKTDKVISGINIAEVWRDPTTMDFHALAVLSRSQASASLQEEIGKIDAAVQLEVESAQAASDPLLKIGALSRAADTAVNRDGFQASLKVVDPAGHGIEAPIPQAVLRARLADTFKSVKVAAEVEDDDGVKEFAGILKGGVAAAGFLAEGSASADFALVGKLNLDDLGVQNGWNWMRGTVEVHLVEKESGRVRGSKTWPIKASAKNARTARSRALIEAERLLKQELRPAILGFANS